MWDASLRFEFLWVGSDIREEAVNLLTAHDHQPVKLMEQHTSFHEPIPQRRCCLAKVQAGPMHVQAPDGCFSRLSFHCIRQWSSKGDCKGVPRTHLEIAADPYFENLASSILDPMLGHTRPSWGQNPPR